MNEADRRARVESEITYIISGHGGETIIAGPTMYKLVQELVNYAMTEPLLRGDS